MTGQEVPGEDGSSFSVSAMTSLIRGPHVEHHGGTSYYTRPVSSRGSLKQASGTGSLASPDDVRILGSAHRG